MYFLCRLAIYIFVCMSKFSKYLLTHMYLVFVCIDYSLWFAACV